MIVNISISIGIEGYNNRIYDDDDEFDDSFNCYYSIEITYVMYRMYNIRHIRVNKNLYPSMTLYTENN